MNVGAPIDTPANDITPMLSADGLTLIFASDRAGGQGNFDVWMSTRTTIQDEWGGPVNIGGVVNSVSDDLEPSLSPDDRALVFASQRSGGYGNWDLWMTTRKTHSDSWGSPVNLGPRINSYGHEGQPMICADGQMLYFYAHTLPGNLGWYDLWEAPIIPIVDFNGDEIVDIKDLLRLIESWGEDDPSMDMGPMPWGDGKVDAKDLEVLMRYWQQEILPPELAAYWKLDEAEGTVAADKVGTNDGTLVGNPVWQPSGGKVGGALQLDGIDDYVRTPFVVNPADGAFSVFAWIRGGAAGQVLLSQEVGAHWLCVDTQGCLMTELKQMGRSAKNLTSAVVITDGAWHRVGLVWDGGNRILYVDGSEAGRDASACLTTAAWFGRLNVSF
jgi:hypothetical protein